MNDLLIFEAWYSQGFGYGAWKRINAIVTANSRGEALGFLLERYPDTEARYWNMVQIDLSAVGVYHISESDD